MKKIIVLGTNPYTTGHHIFAIVSEYGAITEPIERSNWQKPISVNTSYIV